MNSCVGNKTFLRDLKFMSIINVVCPVRVGWTPRFSIAYKNISVMDAVLNRAGKWGSTLLYFLCRFCAGCVLPVCA